LRWLDCFDDPAAAQNLYTQAFPLVDITVIPDDEIKTHRKVALLEYVQKHIHEKDINTHLNNITELMEKCKPIKEEVQSFMHYLTQEGNALDTKKSIHILGKNTPRYREDMMTIAEQWMQEGMHKGIHKGRQEGIHKGRQLERSEIALKLMCLNTDRALVEQPTGLNSAELDALMNSIVKKNS
jgi:predicted transposase/invertase (TIGR01784 family)